MTWRLLASSPESSESLEVEDRLEWGPGLVLRVEGEQLEVEGKGAALNHVRLAGRAVLRPGDLLTVGERTLLVMQTHPVERDPLTHEQFEGRLAERLEQAKRSSTKLSLWLLKGPPGPSGLWGTFAPGILESLHPEPIEGPELLGQAHYPQDGSTLEQLYEVALDPLFATETREEPIFHDPVMLHLSSMVDRLARDDAKVAFEGEAGTGKTTFARLMHQRSPRAAGKPIHELEGRDAAHRIWIPPLRDRPEEILPLAEHFLLRGRRLRKATRLSLSSEAKLLLTHHDWPGNVRELRLAMERASLLAKGEEIRPHHLPAALSTKAVEMEGNLRTSLKAAEKDALLDVLGATGWNVTESAKRLGLPRRTVVYRMHRLQLKRPPK